MDLKPGLIIYENCFKARYLDERLQQLFHIGMPMNQFLSGVGAEIGTGTVASLLDSEDSIIPHYRGFSEILSRQVSLESIAAEVLRKKLGHSKGAGDLCSFHDEKRHVFGSSIVLGTKFSIIVGIGLAMKLRKESGVAVIFFGDGEASRSTFGSALNLASLWKLPILFVCRNNGVSIDAGIEEMSSTKTIAERAQGYDISTSSAHDTEWEQLYGKAKESIEFVRKNKKPFLLEIMEKRFGPHLIKSRKSAFLGNMIPTNDDPLYHFEMALKKNGTPDDKLTELKKKATDSVENAIDAAMEAQRLLPEEFLSIYHE